MIDLTTGTMLALTVAGFVTPWIVEIIKRVFKNPHGKAALTLSIVVSFIIAIGVLGFGGDLAFNDPFEIFVAAGLVLGIASTVYKYIEGAVRNPVHILAEGIKSKIGRG